MAGREYFGSWEREAHALEVVASELVVTTPSGTDLREFAPLSALLQRVHRAFGIDLAFVSEWCGEPVVRPEAGADALRMLCGRRVLESLAPGTGGCVFHALTVSTRSGGELGTLCVRSAGRQGIDAVTEDALRSVARLIGSWFEAALADPVA